VAFVKWNVMSVESHGNCGFDFVRLAWMDRTLSDMRSEVHCTHLFSDVGDHELFRWQNLNTDKVILDWNTDSSVARKGWQVQVNCVDLSNLDECAEGMHGCHSDAICTDQADGYSCACKPDFYTGDGFQCDFIFGSKFLIDKYRHTVNIADRYVQSEIAMVVQNKNTNEGEFYEFGVKLDDYEFISGLTMRVGDNGPVTIGDVHLEQEAQEIFDNAVANGQGAAITEQEVNHERDTTFSTTVFVPAGERLYIWLNYDMQLTRTMKNYKYKTNVRPYDPVELFEVIIDINESRPLKQAQTYVWWESQGKPNQRSMQFNREEMDNGRTVFSYQREGLVSDVFVDQLKIEYDVNRPTEECGDIIMRDGYFVHYIAPEGVDPLPKNIILTVDTSGSMGFHRMEQAKSAMLEIMDELTMDDTFWLQEFNTDVSHFSDETLRASPGNVEQAKEWIRNLNAGGGTNLYMGASNSVNRPLDSERANLAFIISDGFPTSGITDWSAIQANILQDNKRADGQGQKWALFQFGIGSGAPMEEISKMAVQNMAVARQVFDDSHVSDVLASFFDEYATPLIWNNKFNYNGAENFDCSSTNLYLDQELVCIGQLEDACSAPGLEYPGLGQLLADDNMFKPNKCKVLNRDQCAEGSNGVSFIPDDQRDPMDNPFPKPRHVDLAKVFAYQNMKRMLNLYAATRNETLRVDLKTQIGDFAVENDFVTRFTSLVVVAAQTRKRRSKEKQRQIRELFDQFAKDEMMSLDQSDEHARVRRDYQPRQLPMHQFRLLALIIGVVSLLTSFRRVTRRVCGRRLL